MAVTLGWYPYLNCASLRRGLHLVQHTVESAVPSRDPVFAEPAELAEMVLAGDVDVAPMSLLEYLRHALGLRLLPGLSIGSDGPVRSCVVLSRRPLGQLGGRAVAVSGSSRTTVGMVQVLLACRYRVAARFEVVPCTVTEPPPGVDALVLIGDRALAAAARPKGVAVFDVGALWREWSGLPAVFAVWVARAGAVRESPDDVRVLHDQLLVARDLAVSRPGVVEAVCRQATFGSETVRDYLTRLRFGLGPRELAGVRKYAESVARLGLTSGAVRVDDPQPLARCPS